MSDTIEINTKGLEKLIKALKAPPPKARIGILGDKTVRTGQLTNATVGAIHEFGTGRFPVRSFLRVPLIDHLGKRVVDAGLTSEESIKAVVIQGTLVPWVKTMAIIAEGIVAEAFDTSGFGKWSQSNMSGKKNHQTLVETGQLRNSITSEVKE